MKAGRSEIQRAQSVQFRRGETGEFYLPVIRRVTPETNGSTTIQAQADLIHAPVPDRRYAADSAWVDAVDDSARIVFGQRKVAGQGLRSIVVVSLSPMALANLMETCRDFLPKMRTYFSANKMTARVSVACTEEPPHAVQLVANMVAVAYSGRECVVDFYYFSPKAVSLVQGGQSELAIDPVVRIDAATDLIGGVLDKLEELNKILPKEAT